MKPKNVPLFYAGMLTGLVGVWVFTFTLYWLGRETGTIQGANIGAGMLGLLSWLLGLVSVLLLGLSFVVRPRK